MNMDFPVGGATVKRRKRSEDIGKDLNKPFHT